jgi:hypothetical protein
MEAVFGNSAPPPTQVRIGGGRTIGRDDVEGVWAFYLLPNGEEEVEQFRFHRDGLIGAMIPKDVIDGFEGVGQIFALDPVDSVEAFTSVRVIKG